jgi:hypothetical protein
MALFHPAVGFLATLALGSVAHAGASWRAFSDDSPWNQRIPAGAGADHASAQMIADFAARGPLHINIEDWSIPVYFVDAGKTPRHDVGDSRPGVYGRGFEFPRAIPIPDDAVASPPYREGSDNHLCIVDRAKQLEWGLWLAQKDASGRWFTGLGAVTDLSGTGVAPPWFASRRQLDSHRARASGFPLIAGLILRDEIAAGRIEHALVFAYDHCRTGVFVPPASTSQVAVPGTANSRGIPMGGRIQLDPSWDVEHSGLSHAGKIVARALQDYGAYCGDYAGANVLYAENSPAAVAAWKGVLGEDDLAAVFDPEFIRTHFRVLDLGNIWPGQNFELPPPYVLTCVATGETAPVRIDQLSRTITVSVPRSKAQLDFTFYPRETQIEGLGRTTAVVDLTSPLDLSLVAPDGARATWHVRRH